MIYSSSYCVLQDEAVAFTKKGLFTAYHDAVVSYHYIVHGRSIHKVVMHILIAFTEVSNFIADTHNSC